MRNVCETFEAGAIVNPENLLTQVQGAIVMGLGPALREEMKFEDGQMLNAAFSKYLVPRFDDVPELDIHLLNKPLPVRGPNDSPSAGRRRNADHRHRAGHRQRGVSRHRPTHSPNANPLGVNRCRM